MTFQYRPHQYHHHHHIKPYQPDNTRLGKLPWFIWEEILDLVFSDGNPELCLVNRRWFRRSAGRLILLQVQEVLRYRVYSFPTKLTEELVENIIFLDYSQIDWDTIYLHHQLKRVSIDLTTISSRFNAGNFINKLTKLTNLTNLKLSLTSFSFFQIDVKPLLTHFHHQLKELNLTIHSFQTEQFQDILGDLRFPQLLSLTLQLTNLDIPLDKLKGAAPNLRHLIIKLTERLETNSNLTYDLPSKLKHFSFITYYGVTDLPPLQLNLTNLTQLTTLTIGRDIELLTTSTSALLLTDLTLLTPHPTLTHHHILTTTFSSNLRSFALDCFELPLADLRHLLLLLSDRLHSLILKELVGDQLLRALPRSPSPHSSPAPLRHLHLAGLDYLTSPSFFPTLTLSFPLLTHLTLLHTSSSPSSSAIPFLTTPLLHLERALIFTSPLTTFPSNYFTATLHPNLNYTRVAGLHTYHHRHNVSKDYHC